MYDYSGQFAFDIGLPAKSGVSGALLVVVPNVGGLCIWSPRLDVHGNTVRGVDFMKRFVKEVDCHIFHTMVSKRKTAVADPKLALITASCHGDISAVKALLKRVSPNVSDYDLRTPLHLACAEGHVDVVRMLLKSNADPCVKDRWGNTPKSEVHNSIKTGTANQELLQLLESYIQRSAEGAPTRAPSSTVAAIEASAVAPEASASASAPVKAPQSETSSAANGKRAEGAGQPLRPPKDNPTASF